VALILSYIYLQETLDFSTNKKNATTKEIEMKVIVTPLIQRKEGALNRVGYQPVKIEGEQKTDKTIFDMEEGKVANGDDGGEQRDGESNAVMGEEKERNGEVGDETELTGMSINDDITEGIESGRVASERVRLWKRVGKEVAQRYNPFSLLPPDSIVRNIQCITTCTLYALLGATYIIIDQVHPNFSLGSSLTLCCA